MISAGDFRNGTTFVMDGQPCQVVEFQHVKPGKGSAFVRVKFKNLETGSVVQTTFNPSDKYEPVSLSRRDMAYIFKDENLYYFMDQETFEQIPIGTDMLEDSLPYLKEGTVVRVMFWEGKILQVEMPNVVELKITQCEPAVRGDTAQSATKNAVLETGTEIRVPLFINQGEVVRIDTRTGAYLERA
ncbi:MAG: elongation factor P [Clostridiaceae bacterium]|jgi:elongation factor P|nr:elongation factor P [Clostridiaceae bacterium]